MNNNFHMFISEIISQLKVWDVSFSFTVQQKLVSFDLLPGDIIKNARGSSFQGVAESMKRTKVWSGIKCTHVG